MILSEKLVNFIVISREIAEIRWIVCDVELKWNLILWNAENYFRAKIFCEREFADPSLSEHFFSSMKYQFLIWQISEKLTHSSQAWLEYAIFGFLLLLLTNALVNYIWKCYILHYHQIRHSSLTLQSFNYSLTIFQVNTVSKNLTRGLLIIYFCKKLS